MKWTIVQKNSLGTEPIAKYEAVFPEWYPPDPAITGAIAQKVEIPAYIKLQNGKNTVVLKTRIKISATSDKIHVAENTFKELLNAGEGLPNKTKKAAFYWYLVRKDQSQRVAFTGFLLAAIGAAIDASFKIGEKGPYIWNFTGVQYSAFQWVSLALKIFGLFLIFKKGLYDRK